jgi:menaquinone-dependent protoporphyrinogen oxidase
MSNVLVVYATREGQTQKIARHIAERLVRQGHAVELFDTDQGKPLANLSRFDAILVGAPIHAGGYPRSLVRFVREQRNLLRHVPSAFFSVGLAVASRTHDGRAQTQPLVDKFIRDTGWRPARVEFIAGALPYSKYNFLVRFVMRRIARSEGGDTDTSRDYEYTDWEGVERFAMEMASGKTLAESATVQ